MTVTSTLRDRMSEGLGPGRSEYTPTVTFVALIGVMVALGPVSSDLYLPALPEVASDLGTSVAAVQFTISGMLLGAAVGQLLMGPMSDRFGRRRPALVGIGLHVVASLLCLVAPSIGVLVLLRMVQGIGNSAATVTAMAVIRDRLTGAPAARVLSRLILVISVAPLLAPSLGGAIAGVAGWRAVFGALAALGVLLWVLVWRLLPESLPPHRRASGVRAAVRGYGILVRDRGFLALAFLPGLVLGSIMSYVAAAPFILQMDHGLSQNQFAVLFAVNGTSGMFTSQVNASLMRRFDPMDVLRVAMPAVVGLAALLLIVAATGWGGLLGLMVALWLVLGSFMFIAANATALALTPHGERAGSAAALLGAMQAGVAGVVSPFVGVLGGGASAMALTIFGAMSLGLVILASASPAYRRRSAGGVSPGVAAATAD